MTGTVLLVQESRIGPVDDAGRGHLVVLGHASLAEAWQLAALARRQARVRIDGERLPDAIGLVARRIAVDPP